MSTITIKAFAQQIGIEPERLVKQLGDAGVAGKTVADSLKDSEKRQLLEHLRGGANATSTSETTESPARGKITLKKKTTSEIQQTTKTGVARTVQVQTKKRRTFVKREVLEQQEKERQEAEVERQKTEELRVEQERIQAEQSEKEQQLAEQEQAKKAEEEAALLAEQEKAAAEAAAEAEKMAAETAAEEKTEPEVEAPVVEEVTEETVKAEEAPTAEPEKPVEPPKPRREVIMPSVIRKASDRKRVSPIIRQAEPLPETTAKKPADNNRSTPNSKKSKKPFTGRAELHVTSGRRKRKDKRRPSTIQSSAAEQHGFERPVAPVVREGEVPETISVSELAGQMSIKAAEVVKVLFNMGTMVTINQALDQDTAMLVV